MKIAVKTLGCKINQYETSCIVEPFLKAGYELVEFDSDADVYIINTCTVTNRTDFKSRNSIRKALKHKAENPDVKIVVTGCFAQREPDAVDELGDIDLVIDNQQKGNIYSLLKSEDVEFHDILEEKFFAEMSTGVMTENSRVFLKVQDGCDFYCSYCAVPYARGHSRSRKPEKVLEQVELLTSNGYYEFVLGGINLGLYGRDLEGTYHLENLIQDISKIEGVKLIRLSSIEPQLFTEGLMAEIATNPKICSHLHIPLQSGCDTILKSMKRHYSTSEFRAKIEELRSIRPDMAFGFDVITGFPGETDELFKETYDFLSSLDFTYLHNFTYSKRSGTPAADMKQQVNGKVTHERVSRLNELSNKKKAEYTQLLLKEKTTLRGIVEANTDGIWTALSDHYIRVYFESDIVSQGDYVVYTPKAIISEGLEVVINDQS
ncbi:MAG: tRNA (N(6)-L-threonylcarbamoyladenosine(37)-C(2))-methylthiotransferase MtaB [Candidatus Zophobacter franzmannii]|nr:tRNA (N(6)-L-threonylcarbamoyladenosine(37)-C(2))-methylthiotransferase MtaB [Candidatus Zophobacter franzmannii]